MKNDNSIKFWYDWYLNDYKSHFINVRALKYKNVDIENEYKKELKRHLERHKNNYNNRTDKNSNNQTIQDSIASQINQIEALKMILDNYEV